MKQLIITIAVLVLVGCGESQEMAPAPESKPVEPVAEATKPEPPTAKAPYILIHEATWDGNIESVKQQLAAGADVNAKNKYGWTPLLITAGEGHKELVELFIAKGADVNAKTNLEGTPLDQAIGRNHPEIADLLRKHGAKTGAELKAEGK